MTYGGKLTALADKTGIPVDISFICVIPYLLY